MLGVAPLQPGDYAISLLLVIVAAVPLHEFIQRFFASMAERRMSQVMGQADRFRQIFITGQGSGKCAAYLSHFDGVGQAVTVMIAFVVNKDLGLVLEPPECRRVDYAVAVPLVGCAIRVFGYRIDPPAAAATGHGVGGQLSYFPLLQLFSGHHRLCLGR